MAWESEIVFLEGTKIGYYDVLLHRDDRRYGAADKDGKKAFFLFYTPEEAIWCSTMLHFGWDVNDIRVLYRTSLEPVIKREWGTAPRKEGHADG